MRAAIKQVFLLIVMCIATYVLVTELATWYMIASVFIPQADMQIAAMKVSFCFGFIVAVMRDRSPDNNGTNNEKSENKP